MVNNVRKLFLKKEDCCGCSACVNICPKSCISFIPDEDGFLFPEVDMTNCINCDMCIKVCTFQNEASTGSEAVETYAAIHNNENLLFKSSSGGVFSALANIVLTKGGIIFGCSLNDNLEAKHIWINSEQDMDKLRGSKYIQSNIGNSFRVVKECLINRKHVLFSGTPCQIAGLKSYLNREYENLITAELICHGVPNEAFFQSYIGWLQKELKGKITNYKFRDKTKGGMNTLGSVHFEKDGNQKQKVIYWPIDPYYSYFMYGHIYRESCYRCKYASPKRQADFTLGDYWGIQKAHPEVDTNKGVSVLLVNSEKGLKLINNLKQDLHLTPSTFEQAAMENKQLRESTSRSDIRDSIFNTWCVGGFGAVDKKFKRENALKIMNFNVRRLILSPIKRRIVNNFLTKLIK